MYHKVTLSLNLVSNNRKVLPVELLKHLEFLRINSCQEQAMITEFTPLASLVGGSLIGLSAVLLMLGLGRIMGATGVLTGVLLPDSLQDWSWRVAVLAGMMSGPWLFRLFSGTGPVINVSLSTPMIIIGGLIVGIGVTLGSGCTSGHGVCGLARLSLRSIIAVLVFMVSTAITVFVTRHWMGMGS